MALDFSASRSPTVPTDITGSIDIVRRSAEEVAPEGITFALNLSGLSGVSMSGPTGGQEYNPRYHLLDVVWSMTLGYTFDRVTRTLSKYRDANVRTGPIATYTARTPGTYTVSATVTDPATGDQGVITRQVTIGDPSTLFSSATQTIVVDSTGTGSPDYPGATVVTTFDAALANIRAANTQANARRVVGLRGQTYTCSDGRFSIADSVVPTIHFVAAGTGANPVLSVPGGLQSDDANGSTAKDLVFQDWDFTGGYDATDDTLTGGASRDDQMYISFRNPAQTTLFDNCEVSGFGRMLYPRNPATGQNDPVGDEPNVILNDCQFSDHYGYSLIGAPSVMAMAGTVWQQNPNRLWADTGGADAYGMRYGKFKYVDIQACNLYCLLTENRTQPGMRMGTDGNDDDTFINIRTSYIEGGTQQLVTGVEGGRTANAWNMRVGQTYFMHTFESNKSLGIARGATTFESCILNKPDVDYSLGNGVAEFADVNSTDANGSQLDEPIRFIGCSMVNQSSTSSSFVVNGGAYTDATIANNVEYGPSSTGDGPLNEATLIGAPFCIGAKRTAGGSVVTGTVTPVGAAFIPIPTVAGNVDDVTGTVAGFQIPYRNFNGDLHDGTYRGAVAPV